MSGIFIMPEIPSRSVTLNSLFPIPYSPFPIPYSPFPIPYSLFRIPYSPFPIPYSEFPIPYSLFPIPYSLFPIPHSQLPTIEQPCCSSPCGLRVPRRVGSHGQDARGTGKNFCHLL